MLTWHVLAKIGIGVIGLPWCIECNSDGLRHYYKETSEHKQGLIDL